MRMRLRTKELRSIASRYNIHHADPSAWMHAQAQEYAMEYFGDRSLDNRIRIKDKPKQTCFNQRGGLNGCAPPRREDVGKWKAAQKDQFFPPSY